MATTANEMPTRRMNDTPTTSAAPDTSQPGTTNKMPMRDMNTAALPVPTPAMSAVPSALRSGVTTEMPTRDMNAASPVAPRAVGDSPREREKLAAYLREHPNQVE